MASAPSERSKRQAKKVLVQPALPFLPQFAKKQVEPTAPLTTSSADRNGTTTPQATDLDINGHAQTSEYPQKDQELAGDDLADEQLAEQFTSAKPDDEQSLAPIDASETQGQLLENNAEHIDSVESINYSVAEATEVSVTEYRRSSASMSQNDALTAAIPTPSASNDAVKPDEYPGVVTYETSQYGQPTTVDSKPTQVSPESYEGSPSNKDSTNIILDSQLPTTVGGEHLAADVDYHQQYTESSNGAIQAPVDTVSTGNVLSKTNTHPSPWPSVTEHLLQVCTNKALVDWVVAVTGGKAPPFVTWAHGVMLARSPRLRKAMERPASPQGNVLSIVAPMPIVPHAFEAALRYLYSDTVLSAASLFPDGPPARINFLPYILSYWVSGVVLGIDPVVERGVQLLRDFLDWDVLEAVLKEADDLSIGLKKEDLRNFPEWPNLVTQWKAEALSFIAVRMNLLQDFRLDLDSTPAIVRARFTALEERPLKHNPALASMVFGSMPTPTGLSPTSPMSETAPNSLPLVQTVSHILLNIDYHDLVFFYQQLRQVEDSATCSQLMGQLVEEREKQRLRVVSDRGIPNKQRMANSEVWSIAGDREVFDSGELRKERVSFLLPTKK